MPARFLLVVVDRLGELAQSRAQKLPWQPDVILVLGGGNEERPREALRLVKNIRRCRLWSRVIVASCWHL